MAIHLHPNLRFWVENSCHLGLKIPNPEEALAKADLAMEIYNIIKSRKITQKQAAEILEIDQPRVSDIIRGNLSKFSLDKLMAYASLLASIEGNAPQ